MFVKEKPKARWLFLTLSTKNAIDGETLEQSLKQLTKIITTIIFINGHFS
jgi:plasmid rolling circle replication initiator protein Rep